MADPGVKRQDIKLFTSTVRRPPLDYHSKLHEVVALIQALKAGANGALMLDPAGAEAIAEATRVRHRLPSG